MSRVAGQVIRGPEILWKHTRTPCTRHNQSTPDTPSRQCSRRKTGKFAGSRARSRIAARWGGCQEHASLLDPRDPLGGDHQEWEGALVLVGREARTRKQGPDRLVEALNIVGLRILLPLAADDHSTQSGDAGEQRQQARRLGDRRDLEVCASPLRVLRRGEACRDIVTRQEVEARP